MSFSSLQDFWQMGGYGFYVWSAYGLSLIVLAGNLLAALKQAQLIRNKLYKMRNHHAPAA